MSGFGDQMFRESAHVTGLMGLMKVVHYARLEGVLSFTYSPFQEQIPTSEDLEFSPKAAENLCTGVPHLQENAPP